MSENCMHMSSPKNKGKENVFKPEGGKGEQKQEAGVNTPRDVRAGYIYDDDDDDDDDGGGGGGGGGCGDEGVTSHATFLLPKKLVWTGPSPMHIWGPPIPLPGE